MVEKTPQFWAPISLLGSMFPSWDPGVWKIQNIKISKQMWKKGTRDPETNSKFAPENRQKIPKGKAFVFQPSIFRGDVMLVSGSRVSYRDPMGLMIPKNPELQNFQVTIKSTPKAASMKFAKGVRHGPNFTCSKVQMTSVIDRSLFHDWSTYPPIDVPPMYEIYV